MEKVKKRQSGTALQNEKEVYAFLSKTIYEELIEYGVDEEYIFVFSLYLQWIVAKVYAKVSEKDDPTSTINILENLQTELNIHTGNKGNDPTASLADTLFTDNTETLISIYDDVYRPAGSLTWVLEWEALCESYYLANSYSMQTCLVLLRIVNECLDKPPKRSDLAMNILLITQVSQHNI